AIAFGEILGRASLAIGLLLVGAGLALGEALKPSAGVIIASFLKLALLPLFAILLSNVFGLSGPALAIVVIVASVPTAPASYVLARQMGGDAPLIAQILTFQTVIAFVTITITLAAAGILEL